MSGKPIVYWDTCVFLAYLMEETRQDVPAADIAAWIEDFDKGEYRCITSVVTRVEVLDVLSDQRKKQRFLDTFVPPRAQMIQVTPPIADIAHRFRNHFKGGPDGTGDFKTLKTPDAIHLATACALEAEFCHTFDDGGNGSGLGLLSVDPGIFGYRTLVRRPFRRQAELLASPTG